ncbi:hypothetical protein DVH26_05000 [Paenibacillus sp. H1-7]|uniref:hypothetical protein n=1 Tax=Paenibacillus sp. H1-7 TaxID=2282849 RepID=UPI001EF99F40|nr:hypothetical protein [Paenibacillus sp. H1-7]ULL13860.1 hypothetical protein DVH26_05000 [Paenibacillus sp. H1-7]
MTTEASRDEVSGSKRVLLTGGRAPAALELARLLAAGGHEVYMAESCPEQLCRQAKDVRRSYIVPEPAANPRAYVDALLQIVQAERIDWLVPTCEELFYVASGLETLSIHCHVFTEPLDKLRRLHSKWEFIQLVLRLGFTAPPTYLLTSREDGIEFMKRAERQAASTDGASGNGGTRWVLKPVFSRFSSKVVITEAQGKKALSAALLDRLDASEAVPWVAQQYVAGQAFCSYSVAHQGRIAAHAVYPVRFTAGRGACISFEPVSHPGIDRWVERFVQAERFTGQIAFDFIVDEAGDIYPLECNPRATSGIHLFRPEDRLDTAFFPELTEAKPPIVPQPSRKAMISVAMLVYGIFGIRSRERLKQWTQYVVQGQDAVYRSNDRKPFRQQFRLLYWNWRKGVRRRISIMEASTHDIEWNGGELK